jgi:two-component sensor histidine kinase
MDLVRYSSTDIYYKNTLVTAVGLDDETILIGERQDGVKYLGSVTGKFSGILPNLTLTYAVKDYQGGTWFSTLENGIYYFPPNGIEVFMPGNGKEKITTMNNWRDSTLILGFNSGKMLSLVFNAERIKQSTELLKGEEGTMERINSVFPLSAEKILVSGKRIFELDAQTSKSRSAIKIGHVSTSFKQIVRCGDNLLVLQLRDIGVVPSEKYDTLTAIYKSKYRLTCITYDSLTNRIYAGSLRGLYYFRYRYINYCYKISADRIEDLKAVNGRLYVATNSRGIFVLSGRRWDTINQQRGLASNICKAINIQGNNIWVTSQSCLSRIVYRAPGSYDIHNYPFNEYLNAATPGRITLLNNKAFLYSGDNVYIIKTEVANTQSRFYITGFYADNKPIVRKNIVLPYDRSNIRIEYNALFYDCNNEIFYRYRLKPGDEWNITKETSIIFPDLAPGGYTLSLEARAGNGTWISAGENIVFTIEKPFWATVWFIVTTVVLFVFTVIILIRYRYRQILRRELIRNNQKMAMRELETRVIKAQMNPHFIFNALNSIQHFVLSSDNDNAYKYLVKFSKLVRRLLESNTSENTKLEEEISTLKGYIEIEAMRFREAIEYEIKVENELDTKRIIIPHMLIQPFIENAIWHGLLNKNGNKKLTISFIPNNNNSLICVVEDNGVGRKFRKPDVELNSQRSLATEFINQRLKLINQVTNISCGFTIKDNIDEEGNSLGTTVTITIPIINEHGVKSNNY